MIILDLDNQPIKVDIRPSKHPLKTVCRSKIQKRVQQLLIEEFPRDVILEDFTVPHTQLSVDFFIPHRKIIVEVQGEQHAEYTPFFHGERNKGAFAHQQIRDTRKCYWAEINQFHWIEIIKDMSDDEIRAAFRV